MHRDAWNSLPKYEDDLHLQRTNSKEISNSFSPSIMTMIVVCKEWSMFGGGIYGSIEVNS